MKRIIRLCLLLIIFLCTSCMHNQETCNETADDRTIVLPEPFSEMCAESQIRLAMCLYGEQYSFDVPIDDNASSYLHQAASVLTGFKRLTSAAEFEDDIKSENYSSLKGVWLTYLYHVFDEGYGDTEISPARINLFINHHSSYMGGEMQFPRWELRKLMQGPNFYWADISNHSYTPVSFTLELKYLMEYGLAGLKSIRDVADVISPDGKAGLLSFDSDYNNNFSQSIILLEGDDGIYCNMWFIDKQGYVQSNHYSTITMGKDNVGETVYKFSWNIDDYTVEPSPERRFILKNGKVEEQEL